VEDRITFVNGAAIRLLGAEHAEDLVGLELQRVVNRDSDLPEREGAPRGVPATPRFHERPFTRLDGSVIDLEVASMVLESAAPATVQLVMRDVSERKIVERQIRNLAYHDALTGLPNRILLQDRAEIAIEQARRASRFVGVFFIDLDGFKEVNDSLGHAVGDRLLVAVAERLPRAIRKGDTLARLGGDEFVLVLPDLSTPDEIVRAAGDVLREMSTEFRLECRAAVVTASIGIAVFPQDGGDFAALLQRADAAMYQAKVTGKNRWVRFGG
jgi:diguanylate cyclase (GGDEF)-like protein/PAS domain S-box-containing protein